MHVTAVDIDRRADHMDYIQFSLLHIPAVVLVGDSMAMRFHGEWSTLAHVMGGWNAKLRRAEEEGKPAQPPSPATSGNDTTHPVEPKAKSFDVEKTGQLRLF